MSDLTYLEKSQLEKLFQMRNGYVLDFSNRTFEEFILNEVTRSIDDPKYRYSSSSKANRLRKFWKVESNHVVGRLTRAMVEYAESINGIDESLIATGHRIAKRLLSSPPVQELESIQPLTDDRAFEALAQSVRDAIEDNEPEGGLDRLHTFVSKYVREMCKQHGLGVSTTKPLHSAFGEYVKYLRGEGLLESEMTERILKSSISTFEAFNDVRNNRSFAHDNALLNYEESLLIFNHVCASIRFVQSVELRLGEEQDDDTDDDAIPF